MKAVHLDNQTKFNDVLKNIHSSISPLGSGDIHNMCGQLNINQFLIPVGLRRLTEYNCPCNFWLHQAHAQNNEVMSTYYLSYNALSSILEFYALSSIWEFPKLFTNTSHTMRTCSACNHYHTCIIHHIYLSFVSSSFPYFFLKHLSAIHLFKHA